MERFNSVEKATLSMFSGNPAPYEYLLFYIFTLKKKKKRESFCLFFLFLLHCKQNGGKKKFQTLKVTLGKNLKKKRIAPENNPENQIIMKSRDIWVILNGLWEEESLKG